MYRVYFNDFGNVSVYYTGQKAAFVLSVVSSSPNIWSIFISTSKKMPWAFGNYPKALNVSAWMKTQLLVYIQ